MNKIEHWATDFFKKEHDILPIFLKNIDFDWKNLKQSASYFLTHDWDDNVFFQLGEEMANLLFRQVDLNDEVQRTLF